MPDFDPVNRPAHYAEGRDPAHEPINVIEAWDLGFCLGNAVKYISRAGRKDSSRTIEDLRKAAWYVNKQIEFLEQAAALGDVVVRSEARYVPVGGDAFR